MAMTPAVVVGSGLGALGALRLLNHAGIPTYLLPAAPSLESRSRFARRLPGTKETLASAPLAAILGSTTLERAALIPCSDAVLAAMAQLPGPLAARFPSSTPAGDAVGLLTCKDRFANLLQQLAVPHPRTLVIEAPQDLQAFAGTSFTHLFLKPVDSASFMRAYGVKGCRVRDLDDARTQLAKIHADGHRVVVQEFIPGPGSAHYLLDGFIDAGGRLRATFARRRLRMYPPDFGNSTLMASVPLGEVEPAVQVLRTVLGAAGYRGIFSAEFKRDERDGTLKILEVNARVWIYVEFTGRCGIDVCTMSYRDALGLPVADAAGYRAGVRMVCPYMDLAAVRYGWLRKQITATEWLRSWVGAQQPAFRFSDPLPGLADWAELGGRVLRRALRGSRAPS